MSTVRSVGSKCESVVQGKSSDEGGAAQTRQEMRENRWNCKIKVKTKLGTDYSYYWILIVKVKQPKVNTPLQVKS